MRGRQLRTRVLILVLLGIIITAIVGFVTSAGGLLRVRDRASADSEQALTTQATDYLQQIAQGSADAIKIRLQSVEQIAMVLATSLTRNDTDISFETTNTTFLAEDGRRYAQGRTTVILPASPELTALNEVNISSSFEVLLPVANGITPDISRISYIGIDDFMRTYPPVLPALIEPNWKALNEPALVRGNITNDPDRKVVWTNEHLVFAGIEPVVSAVMPVYRNERFSGVVSVDYKVSEIDRSLASLNLTGAGFSAILDENGFLIAGSEKAQRGLFGRTAANVNERRTMRLDPNNPDIAILLDRRLEEKAGTLTATIQNVPYLLAYAPIENLRQLLIVAVPASEFTAAADANSQGIRNIAQQTMILSIMLSLLVIGIITWLLREQLQRQFVRPLDTLIAATDRIASGDLQTIHMPYEDEIGRLAQSFNTMIESIHRSQAEIIANNQRLESIVEQRTGDLKASMEQTASVMQNQQQLLDTLNRTGSPLIPISKGVVVVPFVGQLNQERLQFTTSELLNMLEHQRIKMVLFDLTGAPLIDQSAAQGLGVLINATRLLGAQIQLVGISPEIAEMLVQLHVDLHGVRTSSDLQTAVAALGQIRVS